MGFSHYEYLLQIVLRLPLDTTRCFGVLVGGFLFPRPGSWLCESVAVPWLWWPPAHSMVQMSSLLARASPHPRTRPALTPERGQPSHQNEASPLGSTTNSLSPPCPFLLQPPCAPQMLSSHSGNTLFLRSETKAWSPRLSLVQRR